MNKTVEEEKSDMATTKKGKEDVEILKIDGNRIDSCLIQFVQSYFMDTNTEFNINYDLNLFITHRLFVFISCFL